MAAKKTLSKKNPYYISKYRKLELKYFCLQYPEWKQALSNLSFIAPRPDILVDHDPLDPVSMISDKREPYVRRITLVEEAANETDSMLGAYILRCAAYGLSYEHVRTKYNIPCNRRDFYNLYRKFFYILSQKMP